VYFINSRRKSSRVNSVSETLSPRSFQIKNLILELEKLLIAVLKVFADQVFISSF